MFYSYRKTVMKIGIWNTAFLGDAVLTLPLIHTVAQAYPEAKLFFYVRGGLEELFRPLPDLHRVHGFYKRSPQNSGLAGWKAGYRLGLTLAREEFDLWICPHQSLRSALISRWTSTPKRIGYSSPWYNQFCYTHTTPRNFHTLHEIDRLLQLARILDIPLYDTPELTLAEPAQHKAQNFFDALPDTPDTPVVGIHPGSTWPTKRWPASSVTQLIDKLTALGIHVLLFGNPEEKKLIDSICNASHATQHNIPLLTNLAGRLTLPELAAFLNRLNCYITNDSGPMHLAWIQNTPVVALFGPTVRELGFFPRGPYSTVVEAECSCRPCGRHGHLTCPEQHHSCMHDIYVDTVFDAALKYLEQ